MKFEDDYDNRNNGVPMLYTAVGVSVFILAVLGVVMFLNRDSKNSSGNYQMLVASREDGVPEGSETDRTGESTSGKITADDLDFWDMYPQKYEDEEDDEFTDADMVTDATYGEKEEKIEPTPDVTPKSEEENFDDGLHYKIDLSDGSFEWLKIDSTRALNNYDFTKAQISDGKMRYFVDGREASRVGIDVSRYQGDIDYAQVKNAGIQFVMIRIGARGYQSGQLTVDEYFEKNIQGALAAGLDVGVYFYSQAINATEAVEETNVVRSFLNGRQIKYPVAFVMEPAANDTARTDNLTIDERTQVALSFLSAMRSNGYKTLLYGNEEWLSKKLDMKKLENESVWLSDDTDMTDYPYQFSMWRYSTKGSVPGINGNVNMDISFVDYTAQ